MARLDGRVALITGGGGSIGGATARAFVEEGAKVVLADLDEEGMAALAADLGDAAVTVRCDVTDEDAVANAVRTAVDRFGGLHVAFANAGVFGTHHSVAEYPVDVFDDVMAVNVRGSFLVCKHAMAAMGDGPGAIVINSSVVGLTAAPGILAYATAKHALVGLMRTAAHEGAKKAIRVNTIHPGPVANDFRAGTRERHTIPLGRHARPEEVARSVLYLASAQSSFTTGSTLVVDGGMSA